MSPHPKRCRPPLNLLPLWLTHKAPHSRHSWLYITVSARHNAALTTVIQLFYVCFCGQYLLYYYVSIADAGGTCIDVHVT